MTSSILGERVAYVFQEDQMRGTWVAQWVKPLPLAQVMISGSWDRAPHRALCSTGSLLPSLSAYLSAYLWSLSNKWNLKKKKKKKEHIPRNRNACILVLALLPTGWVRWDKSLDFSVLHLDINSTDCKRFCGEIKWINVCSVLRT